MMDGYTMIYSEERGTWNIFNGAEWYAEGTYEQMEKMMDNIRTCELEEDDAYYNNVPDDYFGDIEED